MAYQGHKSRAAWNVALWIANDEGLYRCALDCIRATRTRDEAAERLLDYLKDCAPKGEAPKTPDGYKYSKTTIRAALSGLS